MKNSSLLLLFISTLLAGELGKIAGRVVDENQQPLPGANIIVQGTTMGAAANDQGDYYILNLPPATYTVTVSMIGFKSQSIRNVIVKSDFTTTLSIEMEQTVLEGDMVEIVRSRPMIQRDATSSIKTLVSESIEHLPVDNVQDILSTQAGFTEDASGELHVRGGRSRELLYIVDGFVVRDPMEGRFIGNVDQNTIQELTVISGTFNAEYGQAMSGAVNIVTKDGGDSFSGRLETSTINAIQSRYHIQGAFSSVKDTLYQWVDIGNRLFQYYTEYKDGMDTKPHFPFLMNPMDGNMSISLGGPLLSKNLRFYGSVSTENRDSYLPHGSSLHQDASLKLTHFLNKLRYSAQLYSSHALSQGYSHKWKYLPFNNAHRYSAFERFGISVNHTLSPDMYYKIQMATQRSWNRIGVKDLQPDQYEKPNTGNEVYFYTSGTNGTYANSFNRELQVKGDVIWQATLEHMIKCGFQYFSYDVINHRIEEPWIDGLNFEDDSTFHPVEAAFYIQDKIEFPFLVFNLGLRMDYLDPGAGMWEDIGRFGFRDPNTNEFVPAEIVAVEPTLKWSPRVGIAYPVTDETVFHFAYGHFLQTPTFDAIYYNSNKDLSASLPLVGNPRVSPQQTVSFETGIKYQFSPQGLVQVTLWSKDIRGLLSTQQMRYLSTEYVVYTNTDYASVKGWDITLEENLSNWIKASITYTYSIAKGNNSNPIAGYFSAYTNEEIPHQEYFLDFDQRHDISLNLSIHSEPKLGINGYILMNAGSGLPYTPYVDPAFRVDINSARKPWTFTMDGRFEKSIFTGKLVSNLYMEVKNLTNYTNVYQVYSRTGKPFDPGSSLVGTSPDANHNPASVGAPRDIRFGVTVSW